MTASVCILSRLPPNHYQARAVNREKKFGGARHRPDAASLVKKLRQGWTQGEAHNVIRAMATKGERTLQKKK